jgi:hypothetical protein
MPASLSPILAMKRRSISNVFSLFSASI